MKKNRKIILFIIIVLIIALLICVKVFNKMGISKNEINNNKLENEINDIPETKEHTEDEIISMVEQYINNKYNMNLKIIKYFSNENMNNYKFEFNPVEELDLYATLYNYPLKKDNLKYLNLNITNIEKAKEFKEFVETNSGLKCTISEYKTYEKTGIGSEEYYEFYATLEDNNYNISGRIYGTLDNKKNNFNISDFLKQDYNLENLEFKNILNDIKEANNNQDNREENNNNEILNKVDKNSNGNFKMVEEYLSNKYNLNLEIEDYEIVNNDIGIYAGLHYKFIFKPIDGLELYANLDFPRSIRNNLS